MMTLKTGRARNRAGQRASAGCASDTVTRRDIKTTTGPAFKAWAAKGCKPAKKEAK